MPLYPSTADLSTYKVGPGRLYTTIQSALDAIGNATSAADFQSPKLIVIAGGVYDEDLTIPLGRILTLQAEGTVILGNGLGSNWSSTNTRNITADYNSADILVLVLDLH
jgi:pectin methylesterase-like acyl-CoA thioesterase